MQTARIVRRNRQTVDNALPLDLKRRLDDCTPGDFEKTLDLLDSKYRKWLQHPDVVAWLTRQLRNGAMWRRHRIAMLLEHCGFAAPYRRAFDTALRDQAPLVRAAALESLTSLRGPAAIPQARRLLSDPKGIVRAEAVCTFVNTGHRLSSSRIRRLIQDQDSLVRFEAVHAAAAHMKPSNWAYMLLSNRLRKEKDQSIKAVILKCLFRADMDDRHLQGLLQLASLGNRAGRWQAFNALGELVAETKAQRFSQIANQIPGTRQVLNALRRRMSPDSWVRSTKIERRASARTHNGGGKTSAEVN
jgi:hypothetical protein